MMQHIDKNGIYSEDGSYFAISSSTRIINNHNPAIKTYIAELFFENGELAAIIIK